MSDDFERRLRQADAQIQELFLRPLPDLRRFLRKGILTTRGDMYRRGATLIERFGVGAAEAILGSDGSDPVYEEKFITHIVQFPALAEDLATGVMGARPGLSVGESGEHGTFSAIRAKAIAGTVGAGTTTILIEADDNPAFTSATTLFTLALNTSTEVDDTTLDNTWATGDIFLRARCSAVGATAPKDVNVFFYFKERVENF